MRRIVGLAVVVGVAAFTAASLANPGSGGVIQAQVPAVAKTLAARPATTAQGRTLGVSASAKSSLGLRYLFADVKVPPRETGGGAIKCPKKWNPVSGLFSSDSDAVVAVSDAPVSTRKWAVFVVNQDPNTEATVTIGAVCEKGLPVTGHG
jgi:hypothetical protein